MSNYAFDMPYGGELVADATAHAFGQNFPTATPEAIADCESLGLKELIEEEIDFERTNHRKLYLKGESVNYRYHRASIESAVDAGVSVFYIQPPGFLVLLNRPGDEKVKSERLGDVPRGYEASPGLRIRPTGSPVRLRRSHADEQAPQEVPEPA